MNKPVYFRTRAALAYYNEKRWYEKRRPGLGDELELCVDAAVDVIQRYNNIGTVISKSVRRVLIKRFPFGLYYKITKKGIEVIGFRHFKLVR